MTKKVILPGSTIGILGGGQLGRMTAMEAKKMGYRVLCLDPTPNSPCGQVCDGQIVGSLDDTDAATRLACESDCIIYEFENISATVVRSLEQSYHVPQGSRLLSITQDRVLEKRHLSGCGLPVAPYRVVASREELEPALESLGYPVVLKSATGGYDGKGQAVLTTAKDIPVALDLLSGGHVFVLEKFVTLLHELSVIVARRQDGQTAVYPVAENVHRHNILHTTVVPARFSEAIAREAVSLAVEVAHSLDLVGVLAVEMFLTPFGLLINELAPRPHNSGHFTFGACFTSQFEQFVRAACNLSLGPTDLLHPAVMVNILGADLPGLMEAFSALPVNVKVHLYGKTGKPEPRRKMGHLLINTRHPDEAIQWAESLLWP